MNVSAVLSAGSPSWASKLGLRKQGSGADEYWTLTEGDDDTWELVVPFA